MSWLQSRFLKSIAVVASFQFLTFLVSSIYRYPNFLTQLLEIQDSTALLSPFLFEFLNAYFQIYVANFLILGFLTLPFFWFKAKLRFLYLHCAIISFFWIGFSFIKNPTLFSDRLSKFFPSAIALEIAHPERISNQAYFFLLFILYFLILLKAYGLKRIATLVIYYLGILLGIFLYSRPISLPSFPESSVIILVADSLRSDFLNSQFMPHTLKAAIETQAVHGPAMLPSVPCTLPAMTSLLTGLLPAESGVTTTVSNENTTHLPALPSLYRDQGYCTVAIAEFSGDFFVDHNFGFEFVDAPKTTLFSILLQDFILNNSFLLASLSWQPIFDLMPKVLSYTLKDSPYYTSPLGLLRNLKQAQEKCKGRPTFSIIFPNLVHYPYPKLWPAYLKAQSSDNSELSNYFASTATVDDFFSTFIHAIPNLSNITVIITGDHGEQFLQTGDEVAGHGQLVKNLAAIATPWLVFGKNREIFKSNNSYVSSIELFRKILALNSIPMPPRKYLAKDMIYMESEMEWISQRPSGRKFYPNASEMIKTNESTGLPILKPEFKGVVEYTKARTWIDQNQRYDLVFNEQGAPSFALNGKPIRGEDLREKVVGFIDYYNKLLYPLCIPHPIKQKECLHRTQ